MTLCTSQETFGSKKLGSFISCNVGLSSFTLKPSFSWKAIFLPTSLQNTPMLRTTVFLAFCFKAHVSSGEMCLLVGRYIGLYIYAAESLIKRHMNIVAFEPHHLNSITLVIFSFRFIFFHINASKNSVRKRN